MKEWTYSSLLVVIGFFIVPIQFWDPHHLKCWGH